MNTKPPHNKTTKCQKLLNRDSSKCSLTKMKKKNINRAKPSSLETFQIEYKEEKNQYV